MKNLLLALIFSVAAGCAFLTYHGPYIEPLPQGVVAGKPVVVAPPPGVVVSLLPPVYVMPDRNSYHYKNLYYYHYGPDWYWSRDTKGPWHVLPRKYWPSAIKILDAAGNEQHSGGSGSHRHHD
jgi:hypothetical protein